MSTRLGAELTKETGSSDILTGARFLKQQGRQQQPTDPSSAMPPARFVLVSSALLFAVQGCGFFSSRSEHPQNNPQRAHVWVDVESHNWNDITVYLLAGGLPQRLGMVSALSNASFDFPSQRLNFSGGVRLRALPVAGRAFTSETILVQPGQVITWTLENDLDASSFSVY